MPEEMRKAVESMAVYCDPVKLVEAKKLNGTKPRMQYSDVRLPTWLQIEPTEAKSHT
jgi:hypothetical protein